MICQMVNRESRARLISTLSRVRSTGISSHSSLTIPKATAVVVASRSFATDAVSVLDRALGLENKAVEKLVDVFDVEPILAPPPRIKAKYGVKVAEVQLIAHELGKIDFYADFARRAAYHLGLPCSSTIKLPTDIQRWTVLRSPFVHKSSLENFERRTHKRQLTIKDGDVEVVKKWVDYIKVNMPTSLACRVRYYTYETLESARADSQKRANQSIKERIETDKLIETERQRIESLPRDKYGRRKPTGKLEDVFGKGLMPRVIPTENLNGHDVKRAADEVLSRLNKSQSFNIEAVTREVLSEMYPKTAPPVLSSDNTKRMRQLAGNTPVWSLRHGGKWDKLI